MTQHKLSMTLSKNMAETLFSHLEIQLENLGHPAALFEEDEAREIWSISMYCEHTSLPQLEALINSALAEKNIKANIENEVLEEIDWVSETLRELTPVHAGPFIIHGSHDRGVARAHQTAVEINAGLAFGTGHHGTTAGCLEMLHNVCKRRNFLRVLDVGTGSGVLAIAYAKRYKRPVLASDIDPVATQVAIQNAAINGTQALVDCVTATGFNNPQIKNGGPYDLIVANILARPLQKLAADFARHAMSGTVVILSGLLPNQKARIVAAFRLQGFAFEKAHLRDGWLTLVLARR